MTPDALTVARAAAIMREAVRDKSYLDTPLGQEIAAYLRSRRKRLTDASFTEVDCTLDKLARFFPDLELADLEPPVGTTRIEQLLEDRWGKRAPGTYNKNLSILHMFFKWQATRGNMRGDPTLRIERARKRDVYRTTFTADQCRAIIAQQEDLRDRLCLRLLLHYGLRKGALRAVQFKHFDHERWQLTVFTKGKKVRQLPIPHGEFWADLKTHMLTVEAQPMHYLLCRQQVTPLLVRTSGRADEWQDHVREFPEKPRGNHGTHDWWYRCLERAGIVEPGMRSGERIHKSRHTAAQKVLEHTGKLEVVQKLLGHASIQTTQMYADWDNEQFTQILAEVPLDE